MKQERSPENPILNLFINIFLPVIILNKGNAYLDPRLTLFAALLLPLGYGLHDYIRRGHKNYVSLLGLINILLTGGLALMSSKGIWFAFKEASLPLLLGALVFGSAWTQNPAARMMFCNPQVMNMAQIEEALRGREEEFKALLKRTTLWLSLSFVLSSILNFVLAYDIFRDIDPSLQPAVRDQILNEQIARMTWMGFAVIALPLMGFSAALIYMFLKRLSKMTGLAIGSILKT